jgi:hypothetical protein
VIPPFWEAHFAFGIGLGIAAALIARLAEWRADRHFPVTLKQIESHQGAASLDCFFNPWVNLAALTACRRRQTSDRPIHYPLVGSLARIIHDLRVGDRVGSMGQVILTTGTKSPVGRALPPYPHPDVFCFCED